MNENPHRTGPGAMRAVGRNQQDDFTAKTAPFQQTNPAGRLTAVSLYCAAAIDLAAGILPATPAVFGHCWFYFIRGNAPTEKFVDPVSGTTLLETREATAEFANVGALAIEVGELIKAVARLAAFSLAKRHCEGVIEGDDESLVRALDDVENPKVTDRIVLWLDYPPADTVYDA